LSQKGATHLRDRAAHPLKDAHMTSDNLGDASRVPQIEYQYSNRVRKLPWTLQGHVLAPRYIIKHR
jgi:hypothetical protein